MNILLIDVPAVLVEAFRREGHTVKTPVFEGGVFYLPALLDGFEPDMVMQAERLGPRVFLGGLERLSCPTLFWAIDSHLNLHWQRWYSLLFDLVLTPHVSLFQTLPRLCRPANLTRFAWFGSNRAWRPYSERKQALSFCGRVDRHRHIRAWLVELLRPLGLRHAQDIDFEHMMRLYEDTRLAPNESIANEVNFRLLETASAGCLALSPDVGGDQNALLEPGKEFLIYRDGLELLDQIAWALRRPDRAEVMGLAAMRRVQAEHLPEQRMRAAVRAAGQVSQARLGGREARLAFWLALAANVRSGALPLDAAAHAEEGLGLLAMSEPASVPNGTDAASDPGNFLERHILAQVIGLLAESGYSAHTARALALSRDALAQSRAAHEQGKEKPLHLETAATASALALREQDLPLARAVRLAFKRDPKHPPAGDIAGLCREWSLDMEARGLRFWTGFGYVPEKDMLPGDALSWIFFSRHLVPEEKFLVWERMENLLRPMPSLLYLYFGALAEHWLHDQDNWRLRLEYGLAALRVCRVDQGVEDVLAAGDKAREAGQERAFAARMKGLRPGLGVRFKAAADHIFSKAPPA
jgi:hypothetical protein